PSNTPARLRDLIRRRLVREPRNRVRDTGDVRIVIEEVQSRGEVNLDVPQATARPGSKVWIAIAAVLFLTTIVSLGPVSVLYFNRATPPEIRLEVSKIGRASCRERV